MNELTTSKENKILDSIFSPTAFLIFSFFWSTFCYSFRFSWYVGGFIILIDPIYGLLTLLYQVIHNKKKLITPFVYLAGGYWLYIFIIHLIHNDFTSHGVGDIMISMFFIMMLLDLNKEEWKKTLTKASCALLWLSLIYGVLSIIFTYFITSSTLTNIKPAFFKNSFSVWVTDSASRMVGIGSNSNATGSWCAYCFMLGSLYIFLKDNISIKDIILHLSSMLLTAFILIETACRAGILTIVVYFIMLSILYFAVIRKHVTTTTKKYVTTLLTILLAIILIAIIAFIVSDRAKAFVFSILRIDFNSDMTLDKILKETKKSFSHASGRDEIREKTWNIWKTNKLWGVPTGEVVKTFSFYLSSKSGSHNTFLQVLATTGIFGFILHVAMWLVAIYYNIKVICKSSDRLLKSIAYLQLAIIPAIFVDNLYETFMYTSITLMAFLGFFVLATGAQLNNLLRKESNNL